MDSILQTDPGAGYRAFRNEINAAIQRVLDSGWYILGREVEAFEGEFATFCKTTHAVGVANGTDALVLALKAIGVASGDAVVTVSHTAVATVAAIEQIGAVPILVDVDEAYGMAPDALEATLAAAPGQHPIRAVIPVHLYGQPVNLDAILELADRHGVAVVEDCSQAHGATWKGRPVGGFGQIATFSLYPTKNLGAFGDGGVVTTNDPVLAERVKALRQYGWSERYISNSVGQNSRLDEIQAAMLRVSLSHLGAGNTRRASIAALYDSSLQDMPLIRPLRRSASTHVFHQYVVEHDDRDGLRGKLREHGIMTGVHYPVPIHKQPAYAGRVAIGIGGLLQTERSAARVLSLPMHPQLDDDQVHRVVNAMRQALGD